LKGSARMAGAMRLGQLTHLMESYLGQGDVPPATPEFFDTLETSLDRIAFLLDRLRHGETNTRLPWVADAPEEAPAAVVMAAPDEVAPAVSHAVIVPLTPALAASPVVPLAPAAAAATIVTAQAEAVPELETGTRAQLRVRADIIDRLVNARSKSRRNRKSSRRCR
jgi:chemosensory pili system protein ChpA (sensor histidine kinase/response regulator)